MPLSPTTLTALATMPDRVEALFALVPASARQWTPASWEGIPGERFSATGQVCHLSDIETHGYHERLARMVNEDHPDLISLDSYALGEAGEYDSADPVAALTAFRTARARTVEILTALTDADLDRRGTFGEYGAVSLRSVVHYLASHDAQHLACLEWLLGQIHAA